MSHDPPSAGLGSAQGKRPGRDTGPRRRLTGRALSPALLHVGGTSLGYILVGASGFALLGCGPRLLGAGQYSVLAIAWTLTTIFGTGVFQPGEQTVTRVVASGGDVHVVRVVSRRLTVVAVLSTALPILGLFGLNPVLRDSLLWGVSVVVAITGWTLLAGPRGQLAGARDFRSYSIVMTVEAGSRLALCAVALLLPRAAAPGLLAAALGAPLLLSAGVARVLAGRLSRPPAGTSVVDRPSRTHMREQGSITAVSVLIQVVLSSAPLWLELQSSDPALPGEFVTLTSYLRVPLLVVGGIFVVTLSRVSAAHAAGDLVRSWAVAVKATAGSAAAALALEALLIAFSGVGLRLLYGGRLHLPTSVMLLLAASTVLAIVASVLTQVLYGSRRSAAAVVAWALGAVVGTTQLAFARADTVLAAIAVVTALAIVSVGLGAWVVTVLRRAPAGAAQGRVA